MVRKPEISERFNINDIRRIREYNAARFLNMIRAEIVAETKAVAEKSVEIIRSTKSRCIDI